MTITDRLKIKNSTEKIIENYALSAPFSVSSVAKSIGISVVLSEHTEISKVIHKDNSLEKQINVQNVVGYFDKDSKIFYLLKNANNSIQRQRFTIAHELGHYVLGHKNSFRVINKDDIYDYHQQKQEVEANYFAGYLLVPDKDLISRIDTIKFFTVEDLRLSYLSKLFLLSIDAMRIRLKTFFEENPQYA